MAARATTTRSSGSSRSTSTPSTSGTAPTASRPPPSSTSAKPIEQSRHRARPRPSPASSRRRTTTTRSPIPNEALARRNVVLDKMAELGYITPGRARLRRRLAARHRADTDRRALPGGALRRRGEEVRRERPAVRRDARGATTTCSTRAGCASTRRSTSTLQAAAEAAVAAGHARPERTRRPRSCPSTRRRATSGRWSAGRDYFGIEPDGASSTSRWASGPGGHRVGVQADRARNRLGAGHPADRGAGRARPRSTLRFPAARCRGTCTMPIPARARPGGTNLVEGTVHSFNTLYAQLILQVGPKKAIDMAHRIGITTPLQAVPAAVLGSNDVQPLDMASVYGTFANRGVHVDADHGHRITEADGTVLYEDVHQQTKAIDADRRRHRHDRAAAGHRPRDGHRRPTGSSGRRQDRHRRGLQERVVLRLHADAVDGGVGRLPAIRSAR